MYTINFLKYRTVCAIFSALLFSLFIGTYIYRVQTRGYAFTYSVEFTGGTQILFKFAHPVKDETIKQILEQHGWASPIMRDFSDTEVLVRVKDFSSDLKGLGASMLKALQDGLPDNQVSILSIDTVGAGVGEQMRWKSAYALFFGLLAMLVYIFIRFWSFSYAMGAVLSLFHDAVVILLCFLLLDKEISINVIVAILAVLGYSVNDTIVIFTRIRDNLKTMKNTTVEKVVNLSINQTLRRTILTSLSTALVVISLIVLGGETLRDLALALLIGIIFGTYSSIYIASPIMLLLYKEAK